MINRVGERNIPTSYRTDIPLRLDVYGLFVFLVPLTVFMEVNVVGRLFMPDILLAIAFPFVFLTRGRKLAEPLPRLFLLLAGLWLFGQVATDVYRESSFNDYARGWAKITLTIINFSALYLLVDGKPKRLILFIAGMALGSLIKYFLSPSEYAVLYPWKFGYGGSITWLVVLLSVALAGKGRTGRFISLMLILGASGLNIYMGFRSLGGILFVVALYMMSQVLGRRQNARDNRNWQRRGLVVALVSGFALWSAIELYSSAAESGLLGWEAQQHYEGQSSGAYGLILGGRSEAFGSIPAIMDSPVLGHGSWAQNCAYAYLRWETAESFGYSSIGSDDSCLIPAHSHLLGAWVEAGILGVPFWLWVMFLTGRTLLYTFDNRSKFVPLILFIGFILIWDILFSPFGAAGRFVTPLFIIAMAVFLKPYQAESKPIRNPASFFTRRL
ncbi:MAG: hypothetical protein U1A72_23890 [Sulfuritalea sp.]|nr:hypothetical protein [Sulfuritalea sp.]